MTTKSKKKPLEPVVTRGKRRWRCTCKAYPFPHRPGGGLCRFPDPPLKKWKGKESTHAPVGMRRRSAIRRRLLLKHRLHPIRDREKIRRFLPKLYIAYCRRHGYPYPEWWSGGYYIPAMRVTAEGPRGGVLLEKGGKYPPLEMIQRAMQNARFRRWAWNR